MCGELLIMRQLEDQLQTLLNAEQSDLKRMEMTALFWKTQYLELSSRFNKLQYNFNKLQDQQLLPDEIDDGK